MNTVKGYYAIIQDRLNFLPIRKTKTYDTYFEAYQAAVKLARKHYGLTDREQIDVRDARIDIKQL